MQGEEESSTLDLNAEIFNIFKQFMVGLAEFDELVSVGGKFLSGFNQGFGFLQRPSLQEISELVKNRNKDKDTKRAQSYFKSGCIKTHDSVQNTIKLQTCLVGLLEHLNKGKTILKELESLLNAAKDALDILPFPEGETKDDKEDLKIREVTDILLIMVFIYEMIKQDFTMQEKIISGLNLKNSSSGELESYSLMWSLRPFVNNAIINQAWKLIP